MIQLLNNHWLKMVAMIIGFLIWLHVATEKVYTFELVVPVQQVTLQRRLVLASSPPDSLSISVSGTGKQLLRQSWRTSGVRVNASQFSPGRYRLDLTRINTSLNNPQSVILEDVISPAQLQLVVDTIASRTVPVEIAVLATADEGFAIAPGTRSEPLVVTLTGPRSKISEISAIRTKSRQLSDLRNSVPLRVALESPESHGFHISPDSVTIQIEVVAVRTRVYENLPVVIFNLPPAKSAIPDPPFVRVELSGPPADINLLNKNAITVSVDFGSLDSTGRGVLRVDCPSHFSVRKTSVDSVRVSFPADADPGD